MKEFYYTRWSSEGNASAGLEVGRRDKAGKVDWKSIGRWKLIANLISFSISAFNFEMLFRFHHPNDWRFWVLKAYPLED